MATNHETAYEDERTESEILAERTNSIIKSIKLDDRFTILDSEITNLGHRVKIQFVVRESRHKNSMVTKDTKFAHDGDTYTISSISGESPFATFTINSDSIY